MTCIRHQLRSNPYLSHSQSISKRLRKLIHLFSSRHYHNRHSFEFSPHLSNNNTHLPRKIRLSHATTAFHFHRSNPATFFSIPKSAPNFIHPLSKKLSKSTTYWESSSISKLPKFKHTFERPCNASGTLNNCEESNWLHYRFKLTSAATSVVSCWRRAGK